MQIQEASNMASIEERCAKKLGTHLKIGKPSKVNIIDRFNINYLQ